MLSLLHAARDCSNREAWQRLVDQCTPLLYSWLRCQNVQHADADDLIQETFTALVVEAPTFQSPDNPQAFRLWLRKILINRLRHFRRATRVRAQCRPDSELLNRLKDAVADVRGDLSQRWDDDHDRHIAQQVMERIKPEFQAKTWQAFQRVALEGADPELVAAELGLSLSSIYVAKFRVLKRLRQEAQNNSL